MKRSSPPAADDRINRAWRQATVALSGGNTPIEVVPLTPAGDAMPQARLRVLAVAADGALVIERPRNSGPAKGVREGGAVTLYVVHNGSRMKAAAAVRSIGAYNAAGGAKLTAAWLSSPTEIASAQRRECYRLPTGHLDLPPVRLTPLIPVPGFDGWDARLLDLSDRGVGLELPIREEPARGLVGRNVNLDIALGGDEGICVVARVVRTFAGRTERACVGMTFEHESLLEQRRAQKTIQAFSVRQQRRELQLRRG